MQALNQRSRDIFKQIVESYLDTGEPVGSRTLSKGGIELSAASIRNVMADLTELGLLDAPHASAGRMPTHAGLRLFVDGFLEMGDPGQDDRAAIEGRLKGAGRDLGGVLKEASSILSGLAGVAGLVCRRWCVSIGRRLRRRWLGRRRRLIRWTSSLLGAMPAGRRDVHDRCACASVGAGDEDLFGWRRGC